MMKTSSGKPKLVAYTCSPCVDGLPCQWHDYRRDGYDVGRSIDGPLRLVLQGDLRGWI